MSESVTSTGEAELGRHGHQQPEQEEGTAIQEGLPEHRGTYVQVFGQRGAETVGT